MANPSNSTHGNPRCSATNGDPSILENGAAWRRWQRDMKPQFSLFGPAALADGLEGVLHSESARQNVTELIGQIDAITLQLDQLRQRLTSGIDAPWSLDAMALPPQLVEKYITAAAFSRWFAYRVDRAPDTVVRSSLLYSDYTDWCAGQALAPSAVMSRTAFGRALGREGIPAEKKDHRGRIMRRGAKLRVKVGGDRDGHH